MTKEKTSFPAALLKTSLGLIAIAVFFLLLCGFDWGFRKEPCQEAAQMLANSSQGMTEPLVGPIITLCPEGAIGHLAKGFQLERKRDVSQAIEEYQKAANLDSTMEQVHGSLGLLHLEQGSDVSAAAELTKALNDSRDPRYHRGLAKILNKEGETALLIYHAEEAVKENPNDLEVINWLADAYVRNGDLDKAAIEYEKVIARDSNNEHARCGLGSIHEKSGRIDDAIREYNAAALANPSDKSIHKQLADLYRQKGDKLLAEKEMELAGINPREADIASLMQKGNELLLARNYDKAVETYEIVVKMQPNRLDAMEKLGDAHMAAGRDDDAIKAYSQVIILNPSIPSLHYTLGILFERKGLLDKAEAEYKMSLQYDSKNGDPRRRLADIYTLRGNFTQSISEYNELIKLRGDNPILHFRLARLYDKNKDSRKAIDEYLEAVRLSPDNLEIRKELAALYARKGLHAEAERQYQEILRLDRNDQGIRNALLSNYVKQKKYDGLIALLKEAVDINPNDSNSHYKLGIVYDFKKEYELAAAEYQKAIDLNPDHAKSLNALGKLKIKTGELKKAKTLLEAARMADPNFTEPRELLSNIREEPNATKQRKSSRKVKVPKRKSTPKKK
ncbi:tetratricopeptide repeat protein [Geobacter pelophilus]|uniref:Tetratricopeptide repeat protein n=1 Tax=Geoanaerobacter pelophilus TaxID=60036 RepID=A0AAW4L651_9BACT|nr:tetratricopeptide repeat protein [Geoanaerobacter pelophilus]MBT0666453.1 tetratricopeptide repeat protein [Geoanaerobacter pelophilus]